MKPEFIENPNDENYVFAKCMCQVPITYAIKIPRIDGEYVYHFKCEWCGCEGDVLTKRNYYNVDER